MPPNKRLKVATYISRVLGRYIDSHPVERVDPLASFVSDQPNKPLQLQPVELPADVPCLDPIPELSQDEAILAELCAEDPADARFHKDCLLHFFEFEPSMLEDHHSSHILTSIISSRFNLPNDLTVTTPESRLHLPYVGHIGTMWSFTSPVTLNSDLSAVGASDVEDSSRFSPPWLAPDRNRVIYPANHDDCRQNYDYETGPNPLLFPWPRLPTKSTSTNTPPNQAERSPADVLYQLQLINRGNQLLPTATQLPVARHSRRTPAPSELSGEPLPNAMLDFVGISNPDFAAILRSTSVPTTAKSSSGLSGTQIYEYPKRSVSATFGCLQSGPDLDSSNCIKPALNGASLYYSMKTQHIVLDYGGYNLVQLTNSQRIRRCSSFCTTAARPTRFTSIRRSFAQKHVRGLIKELPFANLLRSASLENPSLLQSMQELQKTRSSVRRAAKARHRFRCGKVPSADRAALMQRAYPGVKCEYCARVFQGNDRKVKLARHRRKVHACVASSSWESDVQPSNSRDSLRL